MITAENGKGPRKRKILNVPKYDNTFDNVYPRKKKTIALLYITEEDGEKLKADKNWRIS